MRSEINQETIQQDDEISLREIIVKVKSGIRYLKTKWLILLIFGILGGISGLAYYCLKKQIYIANCTFVLDEDKGSSVSQYAGLASLAGIDLSGSNNTGLFQGDNILELYKSRLMIEKSLLTKGNFNGKSELLIDRYIDFNKLRKRWKEKNNITNINFTGDPANFTRTQDSIVNDLVDIFNKKILSVTKPDKKIGIINVQVSSTDELFAKEFTNIIVETVNDFYIQTKTKKAIQNVQLLQKQADSVRAVLNTSISGVASAIDASPNANPLLLSLKVPSQRRQVDVQASSAIYAEVVKNLEVSRMILRQETPLIQVIDSPVLPLETNKLNIAVCILVGIIAGGAICTVLLFVSKGYKKISAI
ncbi:lipopolysaccharide biosynthesis protein [Mucilaginibacter sp.]